MDGIEVPYNLSVSMTVRAMIFLNSVGLQMPEHCSVALMRTVRFSMRA